MGDYSVLTKSVAEYEQEIKTEQDEYRAKLVRQKSEGILEWEQRAVPELLRKMTKMVVMCAKKNVTLGKKKFICKQSFSMRSVGIQGDAYYDPHGNFYNEEFDELNEYYPQQQRCEFLSRFLQQKYPFIQCRCVRRGILIKEWMLETMTRHQ